MIASFVNLYGRWMASQTGTDLDDRIIRVLEVSARYVIWFIAILMVTIPNSQVSSSVIVNYALPDVKLEIRIPISAAYGSDITRVYERFAEEGIEIPFPQIGCPHA
ncbi:MAG: MscS family rane protein [Methanomicrobiaceae archaeon]|nr:MscS family rane protein [Methanomicrobiaceae archaeon]